MFLRFWNISCLFCRPPWFRCGKNTPCCLVGACSLSKYIFWVWCALLYFAMQMMFIWDLHWCFVLEACTMDCNMDCYFVRALGLHLGLMDDIKSLTYWDAWSYLIGAITCEMVLFACFLYSYDVGWTRHSFYWNSAKFFKKFEFVWIWSEIPDIPDISHFSLGTNFFSIPESKTLTWFHYLNYSLFTLKLNLVQFTPLSI